MRAIGLWRSGAWLASLLLAAGGCRDVKVDVDCRLIGDSSRWHLLDGPAYAIRGVNEQEESSLTFQAFADLLERALELERPGLQRVNRGQEARVVITMVYNVIDRGTGVETYPVYGPRAGYGHWYGGPVYHYGGYGHVGTRVETVHLGFSHKLFLTAWVPDEAQPAGRLVLWEGYADHAGRERSLRVTMPFLMTALVPYYGQATEGLETVKFDPDDERVERLVSGRGGERRNDE